MKQMYFTAVCAYPNHNNFNFFSVEFVIEDWADLERVGRAKVVEEWTKISPHPAPEIIDFLPGAVVYIPNDRK